MPIQRIFAINAKALKLAAVGVLALSAFTLAFTMQRERLRSAAVARLAAAQLPDDAPDSLRLAAMGLKVGRQLKVFVMVSSRCGFCQDPLVKESIRALRAKLRASHSTVYSKISVVGVSVDERIARGFAYFEDIGLAAFDEIATGEGWLNEGVAQLLWKNAYAEPLVPQIVVVERAMSGTAEPFLLSFSPDSLLTVIRGRSEILNWAKTGVRLRSAPSVMNAATGPK